LPPAGCRPNTPINLAFGQTDDVNSIRVNHVVERNEYTNAHDVDCAAQTTVIVRATPKFGV